MGLLNKTILDKFRNGKRVPDSYKIFRSIKARLDSIAENSGEPGRAHEAIIQDLENLAYKRAVGEYAWFKDDYLWRRPHTTRYTNIRYDFSKAFEEIVRTDQCLKNFLVNAELLKIVAAYESASVDDAGKKKVFWEEVEAEIHEACAKSK